MQRLIIASSNRHKVQEIAELVRAADLPLEVVGMHELGTPPEVAETADSFAGNATLKAAAIAAWMSERSDVSAHDLVLADDSGICVDAFDGAPGVYSARFAGPRADDDANNRELVRRLEAIGLERSPASYVCVLVLTRVDREETELVEGRCSGLVRTVANGTQGFGYDPHFFDPQIGRTFAELDPTEKAARSHRGAAVQKLLSRLPTWLDPGDPLGSRRYPRLEC